MRVLHLDDTTIEIDPSGIPKATPDDADDAVSAKPDDPIDAMLPFVRAFHAGDISPESYNGLMTALRSSRPELARRLEERAQNERNQKAREEAAAHHAAAHHASGRR